ncbi:CHAT domain-containing protein [Roseofilum sp. BLCC_M91]|uniref:CHAT domain-containing protein n=1 Tax=Roseofilum halophilum BLCC-M91 TaxID=3022259 RepID=A0ABT7BMS9_9CYAN|nr:CHAT domain-containing protein [Roseofilum halophilum]MDJ1180494.1 CHAT domain-containing protein [Roseofilum halophilum BLCC-M91]
MLQKTIDLIIHGSPSEGLHLSVQIRDPNQNQNQTLVKTTGKLPPNTKLREDYERWNKSYLDLGHVTRRRRTRKIDGVRADANRNIQELSQLCRQNSEQFKKTLNQWFQSPECMKLREYWRKPLLDEEEINIFIHTSDPELLKLPWYELDLIDDYPNAQVVFTSDHSSAPDINLDRLPSKDRVKLLAIFGNDENLDLTQDREFLESIPSLEPTILDKPSRQELSTYLYDNSYDILFFAGHSESQENDGRIYINDQYYLTIDDVRHALRNALERGLQIAIFNSCDGLGLAQKLQDLHIPQVVVMREPVPDQVAQEFLKRFLSSFSDHKSFYFSVREARQRLQGWESDFPNASWLPVIFQNSTTEALSWLELRGLPGGMDWRKVSEEKINPQLDCTSSTCNSNRDISGCERIYVPLTLISDRDPISQDSLSPARLDPFDTSDRELLEGYRRSNDDFFAEELGSEKSPKRIALIGETGIGKKAILQEMAEWILKHQLNAYPIWISLADLQDRRWDTLEEFLEEKWLPDALGEGKETLKNLKKLFQSGRVFLFLEGLDEMPILQSKESPLSILADQLTDWIAPAHVILTCRSNLWENHPNILEDFEVYRVAGLTHPDQINAFVNKWFEYCQNRSSGQDLASSLQFQLKTPRKEKFRTILKNPLCLKIFCELWQQNQGKLPDTKTALYRKFTNGFYDRISLSDPSEPNEIHSALGALAVEALQGKSYQFQLGQMESYKTRKPELFEQAIEVGFLSLVEKTDRDNSQWSYRFLHPNLQEYVAALAIEDWRFFFNPSERIYRIFDNHWKEVILLWLGREDIDSAQKEQFLDALVQFLAEIKPYSYRAYFLATSGLAEFPEYPQAETLVRGLVKWCFGEQLEGGEIKRFPATLELRANAALQESDRPLVLRILTEQLHTYSNDTTLSRVAYTLGKLAPEESEDKEKSLEVLQKLLRKSEEDEQRLAIASSLAELDPDNTLALDTLQNRLEPPSSDGGDRKFHGLAGDHLAQIDPDNDQAFETLLELAKSPEEEMRLSALENLKVIFEEKYARQIVDLLSDKTDKNSDLNRVYNELLWLCADRLNYVDFYQALHHSPLPRVAQPCDDTSLKTLPSPKNTYLLWINAASLQGETDREAIAQALCDKMYTKALPDRSIPTATTDLELGLEIFRAKQQLQKQNLAIIFDQCNPTQELLDCCREIAAPDLGVHIAWITERPLESPLYQFLPQNPNLKRSIREWIQQLNDASGVNSITDLDFNS